LSPPTLLGFQKFKQNLLKKLMKFVSYGEGVFRNIPKNSTSVLSLPFPQYFMASLCN
jgi:hypothetical protein